MVPISTPTGGGSLPSLAIGTGIGHDIALL